MKQLNLSIPTPCHENWEQMTPAEQGRFCASCQKTVIDFTNKSDQQLAAFFKKPTGNVCGRFLPDQLDRDIVIPAKRIPWLRYFFQITLPAFLLTLKAAGQKIERVERITVIKKLADTIINKVDLEAPAQNQVCSKEANPATIQAELQGRVGGVVVVVGGVSRSRRPIIPLIKSAKRDTAFNEFSVYPNPARSNGTISIDCKKMPKGAYSFQVLTMDGKPVYTKQLELDQKGGLLRTDLPTLTAGHYIISLLHEKGKKAYTEKIQVL